MLAITSHGVGNLAIFRCAGRLTIEHAGTLRTTVLKCARSRIVVLDLAHVTAIDAAGLGVLVSLGSWAKGAGALLKLLNLTPRIEGLFELCKLSSAFEICSLSDVRELVRCAFEQRQLADVERSEWIPGKPFPSEAVMIHEPS
jgi:anti-anti-sigma factor